MKTVWKYEIALTDRQSISMPHSAEVLCAQMQYNRACIWALVDPQDARTERDFIILGTGHNAAPESLGRYIGTWQLADGALVYHLFEAAQV